MFKVRGSWFKVYGSRFRVRMRKIRLLNARGNGLRCAGVPEHRREMKNPGVVRRNLHP